MTAPQATAAADHRVIHDQAVIELDVVLDDHFTPQDRIPHPRTFDEGARTEGTVFDLPGEDARRRPLVVGRIGHPLRIE